MATELLVDQEGKAEPEHGLDQHGPNHEMRRYLHRRPDVRIGQDRLIPICPQPYCRRVRPIGAVIGERQIDSPDKWEDIDRQQQHDSRRDEKPGERLVRKAADTTDHTWPDRDGPISDLRRLRVLPKRAWSALGRAPGVCPRTSCLLL